MDRYIARRSFRYGDKVYMPGEKVAPDEDDVRMLQGQGKIGGKIPETATKPAPPENSMQPKAETEYPIHKGGGWYELEDGSKVRKSELESGK